MKRQRGFSLLELLVAFSIMALALGMLYRVSGSSVRNVFDAEQQQGAVILAESVLASREFLDESGWREWGQSGGFDWVVHSAPYPTPVSGASPNAVPLHEVTVSVAWVERGQVRQFELRTLKAQRPPLPGGRR